MPVQKCGFSYCLALDSTCNLTGERISLRGNYGKARLLIDALHLLGKYKGGDGGNKQNDDTSNQLTPKLRDMSQNGQFPIIAHYDPLKGNRLSVAEVEVSSLALPSLYLFARLSQRPLS